MSLPQIEPIDAKRLSDQGATLVDVRDADERAREHIPGSRYVPLDRPNDLTGMSAPLIFHCRSGMRTANAAGRLREAAACEAYVLAGGIEAWRRAGLPVFTDRSQPIALNRQVMIVAGSLVLAFVLLGLYVAPAFSVLAGAVGAGLVFGGASGWCGMAKLLEVMPWNRRVSGA